MVIKLFSDRANICMIKTLKIKNQIENESAVALMVFNLNGAN
jgi:hypothetical protein